MVVVIPIFEMLMTGLHTTDNTATCGLSESLNVVNRQLEDQRASKQGLTPSNKQGPIRG